MSYKEREEIVVSERPKRTELRAHLSSLRKKCSSASGIRRRLSLENSWRQHPTSIALEAAKENLPPKPSGAWAQGDTAKAVLRERVGVHHQPEKPHVHRAEPPKPVVPAWTSRVPMKQKEPPHPAKLLDWSTCTQHFKHSGAPQILVAGHTGFHLIWMTGASVS